MIRYVDKIDLREKELVFGSHFLVAVHHGRKSQQQGLEAAGYFASVVKKQRAINVPVQLTSPKINDVTDGEWVFSPQLTNHDNFPMACLPGFSRYHNSAKKKKIIASCGGSCPGSQISVS